MRKYSAPQARLFPESLEARELLSVDGRAYQRNLEEASAAPELSIKLLVPANLVLSGEALLVGSISLLALYVFPEGVSP